MRIAAMAAGGVGGYFGARLAAAGHDVFFIARGAHRDAIKAHGLKVESVLGNLHLPKASVTDNPTEIGPVDVVLFAVKLWDTEKAVEQTRPLMGADTRVLTLQNGVDSYERLAPMLGERNVVPGVTYVVTTIGSPGVIKHTSELHKIVCGTIDGASDGKLAAFVDAAKAAKIDISLTDDAQRARWEKFVFLSGTSGATSLTRQTMGPILADPDMRKLFQGIMAETFAVGRAKGAKLPDGFVEHRMMFADSSVPPGMKASMANDLDRGNRLELDWLAGTVVKLGRELGIPTPVNETVYAALKPYRMGKP